MEIKPTHNKIIEKFIDDNFFIISELIISKDELLSILKESLKNALSTKSMKMSEKNSSFMIEYLQDNGLPIENFPSSLDSDDLMGIIGEIVSELYHKQCMGKDSIYIKWKATGTSKSKGLDLVFHQDEKLYSIECKHPHDSLGNNDNDKTQTISKTFNEGLSKHDDRRTIEFMALLFRRYLYEKRLLTGSQMNTTEIDTKMELIKKLLEKNDIVEEINIVADKIYETDIDKDKLESSLNFSKFTLISKSIGVLLLLIENIHELSEVVSTNGN